jgi:formyltetrahydrofolate deformylase
VKIENQNSVLSPKKRIKITRTNNNAKKITLLIHCKDQKGIITVTNFILKVEGNITYLDQHVDMEQNVFYATRK